MHSDRVWEILERSSVGMLTTRFERGLRARPLDARPDRKTNVIFFVIDARGLKDDDEVRTWPDVCFTVVDFNEKAYLSITGKALTFYDEHCFKKSGKVQTMCGGLIAPRMRT